MSTRYTISTLVLVLGFLAAGCDSANLMDPDEVRIPLENPAEYLSMLADSTEYIWQNEEAFLTPDLNEYTRSTMIVFLKSQAFGGHDGCQFFVANMEYLDDGKVRIAGLVDYPECPGGFDLKPDTFSVFVDHNRLSFESDSKVIAMRSQYTKDLIEAGLTGTWTRVRTESELSGDVITSSAYELKFRSDRRFDSVGDCKGGASGCKLNSGAFFGVSEDRFLTYIFEGSRSPYPAIDRDFLRTSYYKVSADSLYFWGAPLGLKHVFVRTGGSS